MDRNTILAGDAWELAKGLPDESINCIVSSPPYYGLRDYGEPGQFGLEDTPEEYVEKLVALFRELRRALHPTGVVFLNLGDSYWGGKGKSGYELPHEAAERRGRGETIQSAHNVPGYTDMRPTDGKHPVLKPKDLCMIPARVAIALQADGWWLRQDLIWHKPNPMPASVTDRCTTAHEYVFLFAKSPRYFYDAEAIREPNAGDLPYGDKRNFKMNDESAQGRHGNNSMFNGGSREDYIERYYTNGRNRRSVWSIPTKPYSGAHFAVFPEKLVEPCILAGCPHKVCSECGAPWVRQVEREAERYNDREGIAQRLRNHGATNGGTKRVTLGVTEHIKRTTTGFAPTCDCNGDTHPGVVLDPFGGSGTVGAVAKRLGRDWIGFELNPAYIDLAWARIEAVQPPLFAGE